MNLYFRFLFLMIKRTLSLEPIDIFAPCTSYFRVNPLDLDLNLHMNNGKYFSIMDLGRLDLMLKSKTFWLLARKGYFPVISSESIRFKQSLELFQEFELVTQIETWDDKDFYMNQKFIKDGVVCAEGVIKGRFLQRGRKGSVPTKEIFAETGVDYVMNQVSEIVEQQKRMEKLLVRKKNINS